MKFSILIPHFRNGKTTAYAVSKLLKYRGKHQIDIIVIDNSLDESINFLNPFLAGITIVDFPTGIQQSHGAAFDQIVPHLLTEYFITMESDAFPENYHWLDYYENKINEGYECVGSKLQLSGGEYLHPCGALYKKSNWIEAKKFCDESPYHYLPNMAMKEGFQAHLMIHNSIYQDLMDSPEDYIELADGYYPFTRELAKKKEDFYSSIRNPFHNGMGSRDESIKTYGFRSIEQDSKFVDLTNARKYIRRIGYEPGQFFSYWHEWADKKILYVPTEIKWLNDKVGVQQEYTLMENGFRHLWAGSAHVDMKGTKEHDVYEFKHNQIEELYNSLPEHQKI